MTKNRFVALLIVGFTSVVTLSCWIVSSKRDAPQPMTPQTAIAYRVLSDYMGTEIKIAVDSSVTEEQLKATLKKAADDHQDDPARDYLTSMFLWVNAYLIEDGQTSPTRAGSLRRYVPPGNPAERKKLTIDRSKDDEVTITLQEAKKGLH